MSKTILFVLFLSRMAFGDVLSMGSATWRGCEKKSCYALSLETGGVSSLIPKQLFAKGIRLEIFSRPNLKTPKKVIIADRGFWNEEKNTWVLFKGHFPASSVTKDYYFASEGVALKAN